MFSDAVQLNLSFRAAALPSSALTCADRNLLAGGKAADDLDVLFVLACGPHDALTEAPLSANEHHRVTVDALNRHLGDHDIRGLGIQRICRR